MEQVLAKAAAAEPSIGQVLGKSQLQQLVPLQEVTLQPRQPKETAPYPEEVWENMEQHEHLKALGQQDGTKLVASITQVLLQQLGASPAGASSSGGDEAQAAATKGGVISVDVVARNGGATELVEVPEDGDIGDCGTSSNMYLEEAVRKQASGDLHSVEPKEQKAGFEEGVRVRGRRRRCRKWIGCAWIGVAAVAWTLMSLRWRWRPNYRYVCSVEPWSGENSTPGSGGGEVQKDHKSEAVP